jgi:hypothetical protein
MIVTTKYWLPGGRWIDVNQHFRVEYLLGQLVPMTFLVKVTYEIPPEWEGDEDVEKELAYLLSQNKPSTTGEENE